MRLHSTSNPAVLLKSVPCVDQEQQNKTAYILSCFSGQNPPVQGKTGHKTSPDMVASAPKFFNLAKAKLVIRTLSCFSQLHI